MNKSRKFALVLTLALVISTLALSALATWGTLYVNKSSVKVYAEDDTSSKVLKTYKGGKKVTVDAISPDGNWAQISLSGKLGFIQMKYLSEDLPQSFCSHKWGSWTVEREATCTEKGYRYRFCKVCGIRDEQETKKLSHSYSKWKVTKQATCVKKGERTRTCKVCGHKEKETYLEDHSFGKWTMTKAPTCTATGERVHTCKVCGLEKSQTLDKLPHDYQLKVIVPTTDHSSGTRAKICKVCGFNGGEESFDPAGTLRRGARGEDVYSMQQLLADQGYLNVGGADGMFGGGTEKALMKFQQDQGLNADGIGWPQTLKRLQHDFGPWETVKEMTRTEAGERKRVCKDCGYEQHETVEPGTVFERGRRGEDIRALQQIIKQVGYDAGSFDGIYGKKLDTALAGFAAANGLTVEDGKIRPSDVDALFDAWLESQPADSWATDKSLNSPVYLTLTVNPVGETDDSGVTTYSWSLTNLGGEKVMFNALLLSFGDADFTRDNLVMALDGFELKPAAGNSITGSFSADSGWGAGSLNYAAMAVTESTGKKWLSNTITFENAASPALKTIAPMPYEIDVNQLDDGIYPVSFDRGDVFGGSSGIFMNAVHIYTQDWYDIVDVNTLQVGDTIVVEGEEVPVLAIDRTDGIAINEDQDARAFYFATEDDSNGFFIQGLNDLTTFTDQGVTTLTVDPSATFTDTWDIESDPVTVGYEDIVATMQASENDSFVPYNTTVRIENGRVVEIKRDYMP